MYLKAHNKKPARRKDQRFYKHQRVDGEGNLGRRVIFFKQMRGAFSHEMKRKKRKVKMQRIVKKAWRSGNRDIIVC